MCGCDYALPRIPIRLSVNKVVLQLRGRWMKKLFESGEVRIEKVELLLQADVRTRGCSCRTEDAAI